MAGWRLYMLGAGIKQKSVLSSKAKHYVIMGTRGIGCSEHSPADIFVALISCDMGQEEEPWVGDTRESLHIVGLNI